MTIGQPGRWALGLSLLFLLVGLSSQLAFFTIAPDLVGDGHRPILAVGVAIGLSCALAVARLRRDMWTGRRAWGRIKLVLGLIFVGGGGGATGAELLNLTLPPVARSVVDRPVVARSIGRGRYGRELYRVVSLSTGAEVAVDYTTLDRLPWRQAAPGRCLIAERVTGRLGGAWIASRRVAACAPRRGVPGDRVIVTDAADGWCWHRSSWRWSGSGLATDLALPPGTQCRTSRSLPWLYRCGSADARVRNRS